MFLCCSLSSKFDGNRLGDQLSFLSIKFKEENNLYATLHRRILWHSNGRGLKLFSKGQAPRPQFPLTPYACFISCSLPTTLSPFNTMLVKGAQKMGKFPPLRKMKLNVQNTQSRTLFSFHQYNGILPQVRIHFFYYVNLWTRFMPLHSVLLKCTNNWCLNS